jgi:hypothetical protein
VPANSYVTDFPQVAMATDDVAKVKVKYPNTVCVPRDNILIVECQEFAKLTAAVKFGIVSAQCSYDRRFVGE